MDTLQDLPVKAQKQLDAVRKKETDALHNHEMLKQALENAFEFTKKDMDQAKKALAVSSEAKSGAEGDLTVVTKKLIETTKAKDTLHHDCLDKAQMFGQETKSRNQELNAVTGAKKFVTENCMGEVEGVSMPDSATPDSFLQVARRRDSMKDVHDKMLKLPCSPLPWPAGLPPP